MSQQAIGLSKSTLEIFADCPRCFWLAKVKKIERPFHPLPGILNTIDRTMKSVVEAELKAGRAISYLNGCTEDPHPDRAFVELCRSWRTFQYEFQSDGLNIKVWGNVDELLIGADGRVSPWDYKSKGDAPTEEYCKKYNQTQADLYDLLLQGQNLKTTGFTYFTYTWPTEVDASGRVMMMDYETLRIASDAERGKKVATKAAQCLASPTPPAPGIDCKHCTYIQKRKEYDE